MIPASWSSLATGARFTQPYSPLLSQSLYSIYVEVTGEETTSNYLPGMRVPLAATLIKKSKRVECACADQFGAAGAARNGAHNDHIFTTPRGAGAALGE